ncbi:hypothetical protein VMCG_07054 [Cytospora schulzeri]|uniref:Uncharacterized protein n=1 Tax=Cytospora schulzeri TaxID=448051 RepID=A0A423W3Z3_9PEZI|nr:hypothetical protein VMCG_07054 [Valsa malicola]
MVLYRKHIREENGTAMMWAVWQQRTSTLARLVENGVNVNGYLASNSISTRAGQYYWITDLAFAADPDGASMREYIDSRGITDAAKTYERDTWATCQSKKWFFAPLALAARMGHADVATWLLDRGARVDAVSMGLCRDSADERHTIRGMWRLSDFNMGTPTCPEEPFFRWTPLHLAVRYADMAMVRLLVGRGANPGQVCGVSAGSFTAVHSAALHRRYRMVDYFLVGGLVSVDAPGPGGVTLLHLAHYLEDILLRRVAFRYGADLNAEYNVDGNRWTIFAMACADKDMFFARYLLRIGASPEFSLLLRNGKRCNALTLLQSHRERNQKIPLFQAIAANGGNKSIQDVEDEIRRIGRDELARSQSCPR